jgi:hypothetical protein
LLLQGQLLGIGGKQLQRIKQESAARLQVNNAEGNLNGSHPDPLDPNLHALITADSVVGCVPALPQHTRQSGSTAILSIATCPSLFAWLVPIRRQSYVLAHASWFL